MRAAGNRKLLLRIFKSVAYCLAARIWRAAEGGLSVYQVCLYFFSAHGGQPKADFQHIQSVVYFLAAHGGRPAAAFQDIQVYFACLFLLMQGGRRPPLNTFVLSKGFFAAYGV